MRHGQEKVGLWELCVDKGQRGIPAVGLKTPKSIFSSFLAFYVSVVPFKIPNPEPPPQLFCLIRTGTTGKGLQRWIEAPHSIRNVIKNSVNWLLI